MAGGIAERLRILEQLASDLCEARKHNRLMMRAMFEDGAMCYCTGRFNSDRLDERYLCMVGGLFEKDRFGTECSAVIGVKNSDNRTIQPTSQPTRALA